MTLGFPLDRVLIRQFRCYRIMSLVCLVVGLLACCLLGIKKDANSNKTIKMPPLKETFDFSVAKDWRYLLWCITDILLEAGYNTPAYFLPCKLLLSLYTFSKTHCFLKPMQPILDYRPIKVP